jgi:hypothetical protein
MLNLSKKKERSQLIS